MKNTKALLNFWEEQMKQSHRSSNYFFRKSPSHYHMMLLVMSAYKQDQKISVEVTTLDHLIKIYGLPNYIKIDVEGFELDVLLGLSQKAGIISFEFTSEFFDQSTKCLNYLKKIGYNQFNFSIGESRKFYFEWSNTDNLILKLENESKNNKLLWGDIYCK